MTVMLPFSVLLPTLWEHRESNLDNQQPDGTDQGSECLVIYVLCVGASEYLSSFLAPGEGTET